MPTSMAVTIYTTLGRGDDWRRIARTLLDERLAACVSALAVSSLYRWKGSLQDEEETALLVKTTRARAAACARRIGELHPYEVPCIEQWPVEDVAPSYLAWMDESTGAAPSP